MIPPHERRILEAHVRGCRLSALDLARDERPLNEYEDRHLKDLIKLRHKGLPLQYLTNSQAFYGRDFYVNTAVLVPRPETEGLVELALQHLPPEREGVRPHALDFGTGSGNIALTLALERKDLMVWASDCSNDALTVAKENCLKYRAVNTDFFLVSEETHLWQYDSVPQLDLLISNPPYLTSSDEIGDDVREHEPPEALFAPDHDPLLYYRFLANLAEAKLAPTGIGAFEVDQSRAEGAASSFEMLGLKTELRKDLTDRLRYLLVRR